MSDGTGRRIRSGRVIPPPGRIATPPPPAGFISFSFRFQARTGKFNTAACDPGWFETLLERLKSPSGLRPQEVLSSRSPSLRAHPIDFTRTSEPAGFAHLNEQLRGYEPYQFQLSRGTGRVHGFFIDFVFHSVWLDPYHRLYS